MQSGPLFFDEMTTEELWTSVLQYFWAQSVSLFLTGYPTKVTELSALLYPIAVVK